MAPQSNTNCDDTEIFNKKNSAPKDKIRINKEGIKTGIVTTKILFVDICMLMKSTANLRLFTFKKTMQPNICIFTYPV